MTSQRLRELDAGADLTTGEAVWLVCRTIALLCLAAAWCGWFCGVAVA